MTTIIETAAEVLRLDGLGKGGASFVQAAAPALAREVIRLAAEVEALRSELDDLHRFHELDAA